MYSTTKSSASMGSAAYRPHEWMALFASRTFFFREVRSLNINADTAESPPFLAELNPRILACAQGCAREVGAHPSGREIRGGALGYFGASKVSRGRPSWRCSLLEPRDATVDEPTTSVAEAVESSHVGATMECIVSLRASLERALRRRYRSMSRAPSVRAHALAASSCVSSVDREPSPGASRVESKSDDDPAAPSSPQGAPSNAPPPADESAAGASAVVPATNIADWAAPIEPSRAPRSDSRLPSKSTARPSPVSIFPFSLSRTRGTFFRRMLPPGVPAMCSPEPCLLAPEAAGATTPFASTFGLTAAGAARAIGASGRFRCESGMWSPGSSSLSLSAAARPPPHASVASPAGKGRMRDRATGGELLTSSVTGKEGAGAADATPAQPPGLELRWTDVPHLLQPQHQGPMYPSATPEQGKHAQWPQPAASQSPIAGRMLAAAYQRVATARIASADAPLSDADAAPPPVPLAAQTVCAGWTPPYGVPAGEAGR
eukprot:scaffold10451_cov121-Isochrysis_galbana.AAC.7